MKLTRSRAIVALARKITGKKSFVLEGFKSDLLIVSAKGPDGIGLYRTEIPFMVRSEFPDVDAQAWLYGRVLDLADGRPVTFRTLDVGGDKVLPYVGAFGDDNPAMGWRAIRIGPKRSRASSPR